MARQITTADMIRTTWPPMTATDRKVARDLISHCAVVGLQTLAEVSAKAVIHKRSVIHCVTKLGFVGYPKYQKAFNRGIDK